MKKTMFNDFVTRWKVEKVKQLKLSSYCVYNLMINNHLLPFFEKYYLDEISEQLIQEFIDTKKNILSKKSIQDLIMLLKMIIKNATKKKLIDFMQFDLIYPKPAK